MNMSVYMRYLWYAFLAISFAPTPQSRNTTLSLEDAAYRFKNASQIQAVIDR